VELTCTVDSFNDWLAKVRTSAAGQRCQSFQQEGAAFLLSRTSGFLADEMGLGKTFEVGCALAVGRVIPSLVLCPANLRFHWRRVLEEIAGELVVSCPDKSSDITNADVSIVPYSRVGAWYRELRAVGFECLVCDEAQHLRNEGARCVQRRKQIRLTLALGSARNIHRSEIVLSLAEDIKRRWAVTGTPMLSRPKDLFNILALIKHPLAEDWWRYAERFCAGVRTIHGIQASGASSQDELARLLDGYMLRRRKHEVVHLPEPKKLWLKVPLRGSDRETYRQAWSRYLEEVRSTRSRFQRRRMVGAKGLTRLTLLRMLASRCKVPAVIDHAVGSGRRFVLFSNFDESLDLCADRLTSLGVSFVRYDGRLSEQRKHEAWRAFQEQLAAQAFLGNSVCAKEGLTLTAADTVYFLDPCWTPGEHEQAWHRVLRIGQTQDVQIYFSVTLGTVEEGHYKLLGEKSRVLADFERGVSPYLAAAADGSVEEDLATILASI